MYGTIARALCIDGSAGVHIRSGWPTIRAPTDVVTMGRNVPRAYGQCPTTSKASFMTVMLVQRLEMQGE